MSRLNRVAELRSAVRFPLHLPVTVRTAPDQQRLAETADISAGGVLFYVDDEIKPGSPIDFDIVMPGHGLGVPQNVLVHCRGRVVRCVPARGRQCVAAVIDEYSFDPGVGQA